ncbi:MAG: RDD family protein [Nocardiopsaceae bacterium]|nr:RDD family protein [Nocardiopsaceae bacterium]
MADVQDILQRASVRLGMGRYSEALEILGHGLAANPDDHRLWVAKATAHVELKQGPEAIEAAQRALAAGGPSAIAFRQLAFGLMFSDRMPEALEPAREMIQLAPEDADGHMLAAMAFAAYYKKGFPERERLAADARAAAARAIELAPESATVQGNIAIAYKALGDLDAALRHVREGVRLNPESAWLMGLLGGVQTARKRRIQALEHLLAAIALDPRAINSLRDAYVICRTFTARLITVAIPLALMLMIVFAVGHASPSEDTSPNAPEAVEPSPESWSPEGNGFPSQDPIDPPSIEAPDIPDIDIDIPDFSSPSPPAVPENRNFSLFAPAAYVWAADASSGQVGFAAGEGIRTATVVRAVFAAPVTAWAAYTLLCLWRVPARMRRFLLQLRGGRLWGATLVVLPLMVLGLAWAPGDWIVFPLLGMLVSAPAYFILTGMVDRAAKERFERGAWTPEDAEREAEAERAILASAAPAPLDKRFGAFAIDAVLSGAMAFVIYLGGMGLMMLLILGPFLPIEDSGESFVASLLIVLALMLTTVFYYHWAPTMNRGQTVGKAVVGIRVVSTGAGTRLSGRSAAVRTVLLFVLAAIPLLGLLADFLVALSDRTGRRGIRDRLSKTRVIAWKQTLRF